MEHNSAICAKMSNGAQVKDIRWYRVGFLRV